MPAKMLVSVVLVSSTSSTEISAVVGAGEGQVVRAMRVVFVVFLTQRRSAVSTRRQTGRSRWSAC